MSSLYLTTPIKTVIEMKFLKKIWFKIIGIFFPIKADQLKIKDWSFVDDKNGPFGQFLSCKSWQSVTEGIKGHRFILYPTDKQWNTPKDWTLIDFSTDKIYIVKNELELKELIPESYC